MSTVEFLGAPFDSDELYTLVVARASGCIALGTKTRGFGKDQLVLPGGKQQFYLGPNGISLVPSLHGANRELLQEVGLSASGGAWRYAGNLYIDTPDDELQIELLEVTLPGKPELIGSDEIHDPFWADERHLPYDRMPTDYRLFLSHIVAGNSVTASLGVEGEHMQGSILVSPPPGQGRAVHITV